MLICVCHFALGCVGWLTVTAVNIPHECCSADVHASAGECGTPLHLATFKGQCPAILLLLEAGADVNALQMTSAHSRDR